jgi:uncharacterized protein involved in exopolysaccharide biosynthesis
MNAMDAEQTVSLREIAAILNRRKWQIAITFLLVVAAVAAGTFLMPKQYQAHMKVLVKNERADMVVSADRNGGSGYRGEVGEAQINSEIELLNSNNLLQRVVVKCALERLERSSGSVAAERLPVAIEKAVARLQRNLKIAPVRKANIIQVEYSAANPSQAAAVLQQLAESYLEEHLKVHGTPGTYEFFTSQAARYQHELTDADAKLAEFRQRENIVMLPQQKDKMLQKASDAESALMQADAAIRNYASRIADSRTQLAAAPPRVVTQSRTVPNQYSVERLHTMLAELQNRRTLLLSKFRPDDRMVLEADQEISDTRAALEKATRLTGVEQSTDVNPIHQTLQIDVAKQQAELAGEEARRQTLARQSWIYRQQLMKLGNATATHDDLVRTQKEAEDNYLLYAKKAEEARIAESLDQQKISNVAIAETPTVPHLPSKPNVPLNLALGVLLAGFLSLGLAFAAEYFSGGAAPANEIVTQASELEELTSLPVLATAYRS